MEPAAAVVKSGGSSTVRDRAPVGQEKAVFAQASLNPAIDNYVHWYPRTLNSVGGHVPLVMPPASGLVKIAKGDGN